MKEGVRMKKACFLGGIMALMVILFVGCGKEEEEKLKICVNAAGQAGIDCLVSTWQEIKIVFYFSTCFFLLYLGEWCSLSKFCNRPQGNEGAIMKHHYVFWEQLQKLIKTGDSLQL